MSRASGKIGTTDPTIAQQLRFPECKHDHKHSTSMIQCHIMPIYVKYGHICNECIEEKEDDIIGIWCCQRCRKLPELTSVLCTKIDALQKDMSFLLNFAKSFSVPTPKPAVPVNLDLSDNTPECYDRTVSLVQSMQIQQDLTISSDDSSTLPPHEGVDHNTLISTDKPEESTVGNPATGNRGTSHVKT